MNKKWLVVIVALSLFLEACMASKAANNDFIETVQESSTSGWVGDDETHTWTLASTVTTADADVYVVNVDADVTGYIGANMKVRLEDGGVVKYFGILQVGAYSAGVTPVYLFGGTDYVLSGTIGEFSYSSARAPFGWPMNPNKWTISFSDNTYSTTSSMADGTAVNIGGAALTVPSGFWIFGYQTRAIVITPTASSTIFEITSLLSTNADTTTSDDGNINQSRDDIYIAYPSSTSYGVGGVLSSDNIIISVDVDTAYYIKYVINISSGTADVYVNASSGKFYTIIRAVWGGL